MLPLTGGYLRQNAVPEPDNYAGLINSRDVSAVMSTVNPNLSFDWNLAIKTEHCRYFKANVQGGVIHVASLLLKTNCAPSKCLAYQLIGS
jgi:hypothetical protein